MSWRDGASCPGSDILCSDYSNPSWGKGSHPHSHTWSDRTQWNSHDYTLQHRALTERWIHPRYSQRRSRTTEASKTKAEVRVHGQRSGTVRLMSAKILFAKIYSHKGSTMSLFQNAMYVFQTIYTVFLLIPNLDRLINIIIKYRMDEAPINPWNVQFSVEM